MDIIYKINRKAERLLETLNISSYKVLVFSLIGFFISRISFAQSFAVFSIPYLIVCIKNKINNIVLYAMLILGTISTGEYKLAIILAVMIATSHLLVNSDSGESEDRRNISSRNIYVMTAFYVTYYMFLTTISEIVMGSMSGTSIIVMLVQAVLIFTSSVIINKCIRYASSVSSIGYLDKEALISFSFLLIAVLIGMKDLSVFNIYFQETFLFFALQVMCYTGGSIAGGIAGTILSITLLLGEGYNINMSILSLVGMIMGLFKRLNKVVYSVIFSVFVIMISAVYSENIFTSINFFNTILTCQILFLMVPKAAYDAIEKIYDESIKVRKKEYYIKIKERIAGRLHEYSEKFSYISNIFEKLSEKDSFKEENKALIDSVIKKVCDGCDGKKECWENNFYTTYKSFLEMFSDVKKEDESPEFIEFNERCHQVENITCEFDKGYKVLEDGRYLEEKLNFNKKMFARYLSETSSIIDNISSEITSYKIFRTHIEDKIKENLEKYDVFLSDLIVIENENERYEISLKIDKRHEDRIADMISEISRIVGRNMKILNYQDYELTSSIKLKLVEKEKLSLQYGVYQMSKKGETASGDNYSFMGFNNGQAVIALSDGMGTGEAASRESKLALELVEYLISSDFKEEFVIDMINSILINNRSDFFTTLDICIVDLFDGSTKFIKNGSVMTFVKRKADTNIIKTSSLPIGIVKDIETKIVDGRLIKDDVVILITDGAIDNINSKDKKEEYLSKIVENINTSVLTPQEIADTISEKILKYNMIKDDMTILVMKVCDN